MNKSKIAYLCNPNKQGLVEGLRSRYEKIRNKRYYLSKKEKSKLPGYLQENFHFFLKNKRLENPTFFLSIFKVYFPENLFILFQQKVYKIFGFKDCQIFQLFIEKNDTSFCKKTILENHKKIMYKFKVAFPEKLNYILS